MYIAIPHRTTQLQEPQRDDLLYVSRKPNDATKKLQDTVRIVARVLKVKKTPFVEEGTG